jgi:glycerol-3-phosphate dehydrogenase
LFILPFFGRTLVGTTDTPCPQANAAVPSEDEQAYLISYIRRWFPSLGNPDVGSCWAGGRPLLKPAGADVKTSRVVREHEVETLNSGLISVMGGKWTTCRPMAIDTLNAVEKHMGIQLPEPSVLPLIGSDQDPKQTPSLLLEQVKALERLLPETTLRDQQLAHLQASFGLEAAALVASWSESDRQPLSNIIPVCRGELRHAISAEHARTATDVLARRCRLAMVDQAEAERLLPQVQALLQEEGVDAALSSEVSELNLSC